MAEQQSSPPDIGEQANWWPSVNDSRELEELGREVVSLILGTEKQWAAGREDLIDLENLLKKGGKHLADHYAWLFENRTPDQQSGEFRVHWVNQCLARFRYALRPPKQCFPAVGHFDQHVPYIRATVCERGYQSSILRFDQMHSSRQWGIWFNFERRANEQEATTGLLCSALSRLSSDLSGIRRLVDGDKKGGHKVGLFDISPDSPGRLFELLIVDILNEKQRLALPARLIEDLVEQTDIRVKYPGLKRKHGARLQVGFQSNPDDHRKKLESLHFKGEFVRLSPVDLARTCLYSQDSDYLEDIDWISLWRRIGEQDWSEELLAIRLKSLFLTGFKYASAHPMGALQSVPEELRKLIRLSVKFRAFDVTRNLRSRERIRGVFRPSSRDIDK